MWSGVKAGAQHTNFLRREKGKFGGWDEARLRSLELAGCRVRATINQSVGLAGKKLASPQIPIDTGIDQALDLPR